MNWRTLDSAICGAICLILGWGCGTLLHELCHLIMARSLGLVATPERCTLTTGSVLVHGSMTNLETVLVAVAGSAGLILMGLLLIKHHNKYLNMIGLLFLCRAWIDALPLLADGAGITGSIGAGIAWGILLIEILICGGRILDVMTANKVTITNR